MFSNMCPRTYVVQSSHRLIDWQIGATRLLLIRDICVEWRQRAQPTSQATDYEYFAIVRQEQSYACAEFELNRIICFPHYYGNANRLEDCVNAKMIEQIDSL